VSLLIEDLSFETIVWVLRAIRKDEMTPSDKLIQSRIKECLGMKLPASGWSNFFSSLLKLQDTEGLIKQPIRGKIITVKVTKCMLESSSKICEGSASQS
jgi:hypothetical protein